MAKKEFHVGIDLLGNKLAHPVIENNLAEGFALANVQKLGGVFIHTDAAYSASENQLRFFKSTSATEVYAVVNIKIDSPGFDTATKKLLQYDGYANVKSYDPNVKGAIIIEENGDFQSTLVYGTSGEVNAYITLYEDSSINNGSLITAAKVKELIGSLTGFSPIDPCEASFDDVSNPLPTPDVGSGEVTIDSHVVEPGENILVIKNDDTDTWDLSIVKVVDDGGSWVYEEVLEPTGGEYTFILNGTLRGNQTYAFNGTAWVQVGDSAAYSAGNGIAFLGTTINLALPNEILNPIINEDYVYVWDQSESKAKAITFENFVASIGFPTYNASGWALLYSTSSDTIEGMTLDEDYHAVLTRNGAAPETTSYSMPTAITSAAVPYFNGTTALIADGALTYTGATSIFKVDGSLRMNIGSKNMTLSHSLSTGTNVDTQIYLPSNAYSVNDLVVVTGTGAGSATWGYANKSHILDDVYYNVVVGATDVKVENQGTFNFVGTANQIAIALNQVVEDVSATITFSLPNTIYSGDTLFKLGTDVSNYINISNATNREVISFRLSTTLGFDFDASDSAGTIKHTFSAAATIGELTDSKRFNLYANNIYIKTAIDVNRLAYVGASNILSFLPLPTAGNDYVLKGTSSAAPEWVLLSSLIPATVTKMYVVDFAGNTTGAVIDYSGEFAEGSWVVGTMYDNSGNVIEVDMECDTVNDEFTWSSTNQLDSGGAEHHLVLIGQSL